jgi:hypothetical protein
MKTKTNKAKKTVAKTTIKAVNIPGSAKITFLSVRPNKKTGPKTDVLALVPRKGSITFAKLRAKAEEADGVNLTKLPKWLQALKRDGRIELRA